MLKRKSKLEFIGKFIGEAIDDVTGSRTNPQRRARLSFKITFPMTLALLAASCFTASVFGASPLAAQSFESSSERKIITRVEPEYPDALKRLYIGGVVRVEVLVAPNGVVKSTKLLGGSPILGQSSMKAVKQWRYAPAASEETLTVKLEFDPHR
jgi:TonB family protein